MYSNSWWKCLTSIIVILFINKFCISQHSPCPNIYQMHFDGFLWFGIVDLKDVFTNPPVILDVKMARSDNAPKNYSFVGQVDLKIIGTDFKIKFLIPPGTRELIQITLNGIVVCGVPPGENPVVTVLRLEQKTSGAIIFDTSITENTQSQTKTTTMTTPHLERDSFLNGKVNSPNCGQLAERFKASVEYNVGEFEPGRWPWLAAIYAKMETNSNKLEYICVGSLITNHAVLTAAHCVQNTPANIYVYLGLYNLDELESDFVIKSSVSEIHTYHSYQPSSTYGDIAILELSDKVEFSDVIQPACLWEGSTELEALVGEVGYYAGWGVTATGMVSKVPLKYYSEIVSTEDCLLSNTYILHKTSARTFCAGEKDGAGPCQGDSGTGFFIRTKRKWVLRGMAISILANQNGTCDLYDYVVYTDVAKYVYWIKAKINP